MSLADTPLAILSEAVNFKVLHCQKNLQSQNSSTTHKHRHGVEKTELPVIQTTKSTKSDVLRGFDNSRSDSGKSSSGSPILLDCSFDSGIAGVLLDSNDMQLHKRIQQCQCILLALERDREYFFTIRNRLSKITDRKNNKSSESEFICNVCCAEIDPGDEKTYVKCYICQKYICRSIKCANWLPSTAEWECELCQTSKESLAQTSSWVAEQITFNQEKLICPPRARSEIYIPISECNDSSIHFESVSQIGANSFTITTEQKLKIREYVEEVLAKLLGGNLDTIGVNQLSKSENYLAKDSKANNSHNGAFRESGSIRGNCNDLTDISEIRLRQMIQKIIAETMNLPPLSNGHAVSEIALDRRSKINDTRPLTNDGFYQRYRTEHYFEPTIYQDLLATAVLNKIVDKQLNNNQAVSETNIVDRDGDSDDINDNVRQLGSDPNFNIERSSTTSGSSVEPRSDLSYPEMEQILNTNDDKSSELLRNSDRDSVMSDYLASHMIPLPDLNAMATESDEDDYISVTSSAIGDSTWEKNWLFKKKKSTLSGSVTANSMGMLVPDPKEDVRAQIGDKTADEVSDLSELSSDTDDSLNSLRSKLDPLNDRLVSKHLIGGQNSKMVLDELIERSSIMSNTLPGNEEPSYTDACNEHVIDAPIRNEAINNNVNQNPNTIEEKGGDPKAVVSSVIVEDPSSITLSASDENSESDGCTGFSAVEFFEPTSCTPSVVQILAAMALGPMLAVPSVDQPITMTVSDFNAFTELKELALAEIQSRSLELTPRNLDVIPEEIGDASNQTENIDAKIDTSSEEISSFRKPDELGLPQLGADNCIQQLLQEISSIPPISEVETADSHSSGISSIISEPKQQTPAKLSSDSLSSSTVESAELNAHTDDVEKSHFNSTKSISSKLRLRENSEANENEDIIKFVGVVSSGTVFSDHDNDNESNSKTQFSHTDCSTLPNAKTNEINADLEVPTAGNKVDAMISNEQSPVIIPEENLFVPKVDSTKSTSKVQSDNFDKTSEVIEDGNELVYDEISLKEHLAKKQPQDISDIANNETGNHSSELLQSSETKEIDTSSEITLQDDLKLNEKQEYFKEIISNVESSEIKPPVSADILNNEDNENVKSKETTPDKCSMPLNYSTSQKPQTHLEDQLCHIEITATPNNTSTPLSSCLDTDVISTSEDNSSKEKLRTHQEVFLKEQSSETQQEQNEVLLDIQSSKIAPEGISEITIKINNPQSKTHDPSSEIKLKNILDSTNNAAHKQIKDYKNKSDLPENDKTMSKEQSSETRHQELLDDTSNEISSVKSSETKPKQNENIKHEDFSDSIKCIDTSKEKSSEGKLDQGVIISSDIKISCSNNQNVKLHSSKEKKIYEHNLKISEIDTNEPSELQNIFQFKNNNTTPLEHEVISKEHSSEIIACGDCNTVDNSEIQNEQKLISNSANTANYKPFRVVSEFSDGELEEQLAFEAKDEDEKSKLNKTNFQAQTEQNKLTSSHQSCEKKLKCYSESTVGLSNAQSKEHDEILSKAKENILKEKLTVVNQTISEEPNSQAQMVENELSSYQQSSEMQLQEMQEEQNKAFSQKFFEIKLPEVSNSPNCIKNKQSETENNTFAKLQRNETIFKDCSDHNDIILDENPLEINLESPKNEMKETNISDTYARQFKELTSFEESNEINLKQNIQDFTNSKNDDQFKTKENTLNETHRKDDENISLGQEPDQCEKILNEETSEIKLQDAADSNNNAANELEKSGFETQPDQCDTMFNKQSETTLNKQLSEVNPEDDSGSSNIVPNIISEFKNNTLVKHLVVPADTTSPAKSGNSKTILKGELSELQLADDSNIAANELNMDKQISQTQSDRNDTDSNEALSEVIREDIPTSLNSVADVTSESKNNTLDDHLAEPDEIIPEAKYRDRENVLQEEISEIQLKDIGGSIIMEANELNKDKQILQTQSEGNDTVSNEVSEVKPEDVPGTLNSSADIISESKIYTLDAHSTEPDEIVPGTHITGETILKEELSEIQLKDIGGSINIAANDLNKDKQISQTQSDRNETDSIEQLSEVIPEDIPTSLISVADVTSESKNNTLDDHLAETDERVPDTKNITGATILKDELSEIQLEDIAGSSNIEANELKKDKQISQTESDRNDTVSNEVSEVKPEDVPGTLNSSADIISESKICTLDAHSTEPDEIVPGTHITGETILKEELSEIQLKDIGGSINIAANDLNKDKQISQTQSDRNETDSIEQLSEVIPEDIPTSLINVADVTSESQNNTLDHHLAEPDEIVPDAQNTSRETILEEELSEIELKDSGGSSNIEANELNKDKQISQTESDRNDTDSNEQLSEVIPENIPSSLNSVADVTSESKNNKLDDHLAEPDEKVPDTKNITGETILKEDLSEIQLKDCGGSRNIEANELNKDKQSSQTQSDRNDTDSNEQLSEVIPEDIPTSLNSVADVTSESKNNTLDDHLAEPDEIVPDTKNITSETILKEDLSEIQLKDCGGSSNIEANELNKDKQISQTQSDRNDTDSNEALSEVIREDIPTSLNSVADVTSESKNNTLDDHLAEPDEIIPEAKYGDRENVLQEEISEIQLKDIGGSIIMEANELNKDKQILQTQSDGNDTVSNEVSEVKPEDVPGTLNSSADIISESKIYTLDDHLAETDEIVPDTKNITDETILKEDLSEIQLEDIAGSSNIEANELKKDKQISQTESDRNDKDSNEQLSEVIPENIPSSLNSVADVTSESKNNKLDDHLAEPDEKVPDTKNITGETILKEDLSEIQLKDCGGSRNIEANELNKDKQISQTQSDRNDTDSNEQLSEVIPEDIPTSLNSVADVTSESKNNTLDDHLAEPDEIVPDTKNITTETILKEDLSEIQLKDCGGSSNIEANELNKDKQISQTQSDRNDTDSNEALSEVIREDIPTSLNSVADVTSESKNNTLDDHLAEPDEIVPDTKNITGETILKEDLSEIQLEDIAGSSNIEANELKKDKQISQTESDRNDKDSNEQLSEVIPENIPSSLNSVADVTSESKNNKLDDHLAEPDEKVPDTKNITGETILKEDLSEIQLKDCGGSRNIEANELNKDKQISQTQSDRNDTDSNEQLSEVIPEDIPTSLNSVADVTSESKNNTLDDHLAEPDEIVPDTKNITSETILKEDLSEIQLKDCGGSSNIEANELNKDKQISQTQSDRNDTDSNEALSEVIREDIPTSLNSVADVTFESKNNTLDDHLAEPDEIIPEAKYGDRENVLQEEISEIQLKDIGGSIIMEANELNKDKQILQTQSDGNDTVSNEVSEVKPEDVPGTLNSSADIISESKIYTLDAHSTEPDEIVPDTKNITGETILKEELSEIQLEDIAGSSNIEANELNKDKQISQTESDRNDTDSNEQLSEVIPEDIPTTLNSVADVTSESKNNTLDDHLAETDEIVPDTKNITGETILKEELSEIQLEDIAGSSNIEANELKKDKQISQTESDRNDTDSNEQLSEVIPEDIATSLNSVADVTSESKNNKLDDHLAEPEEIVPDTKNITDETILKEELSEIQLEDIAGSSNIEANELKKDKQISQTESDRNDTDSNEQLPEVIPEDIPTTLNSVADVTSESKNNTLDDHLAETGEIVPDTKNTTGETILKEDLSEIQLEDIAGSSNIEANELKKDKQISQTESDRNDTDSNEQLSEVTPENIPSSLNSVADVTSESKNNTLDDHLAEPDEIVPDTKNITGETIKEDLSEIQLKDCGGSSNIEANELNKDKQILQTQSDRTDTDSNEALSEVIREDIPTSLNSVADVTSESKNNTLDDHLAEPDKIIPEAKYGDRENVLQEEISEIQLKDIGGSIIMEANELNKDKQILQTQSDGNDTVSNEVSEVKPEDVPGTLNSSADIISESKIYTLDAHSTEPDEIVPGTHITGETILKEELSEIQLKDIAVSSNIEANELNKDKQILQTQSDRNGTDSNEQLSAVIPEDIPTSLNSVPDVTSESKNNTLDDHLAEPDEIVPDTKNITGETILKEELSEKQLKEANELNKDKQISQTQSDRNDTDSNEQLSEVIPEDIPTSFNSIADETSESKNNKLDNLAEPDELFPDTKHITGETILKEELSEIQLKDIADSSNIEANELNKDKQISQTEFDRNDTDSNEQLSAVIPEDIPTPFNSIADETSESKNNKLDNLAEPDELVPDTKHIAGETILKEEVSEIQLKDIADSGNIEANELNKDKQISQTQSDRNDTDSNEQLSAVIPEDIPTSLISVADVTSESKNNTLDDHLVKPSKIISEANNGNTQTILKEAVSEIQLKDIAVSSNIEANELNNDKKISQTQSDRIDIDSIEQLSEVIPEDIPTSFNSIADETSESKNNTLEDHLAEPDEIVPDTKNITGETILKEELSEIQLEDIAGSSNIEANELKKDKQISQTESDRNDTDSNEQLSEVIPEDIPTTLNSVADVTSESKNNTLDDHLAETGEIVPDTKNTTGETILKEDLSEIQLEDIAGSSNIEANELKKDKQISQTESDRNDTDSNEQLSEVTPENIPSSLNSVADVTSESKNNTLDDHLAEPDEIVPDTKNITGETIKEDLSEIQLKDCGGSSNIEANELNKDKQILQTQSDRTDTDSNEALSEVIREDIPTSLNSVADVTSESKNNTLDDHLAEPDKIIPEAKYGDRENVLQEEISEIQLKDIGGSIIMEANELNKDKQILQTQSDGNDTVSNEVSEVKPEDVPGTLNSSADIISESKIYTLDAHSTEPDEIVPGTHITGETILKEELSEIQLKDIAVSSNIEANELNKDKQILQTQSDRNGTDSNEQLSAVIPEDIPTSLNSVPDVTSESKNNTLDDHLAEPDEIVPDTKNITGETILKEELSEKQLKEANELNKDKQISQTQSDQNDTDSNEQLSEVIPEDIPTSFNSIADETSESKNNKLDNLAEPDELFPDTKHITGETILKEELSEIQLKDIADSSNIEANELNKDKQISQTEFDRNDTDSNEQLSAVIPEDIPTPFNSIADETSESKNNKLDNLAEPDELVPDTKHIAGETILKEEVSEIQLKDIADSGNIEANELNKDKQISQTQSDRNDTDSNEQLSAVIPEDIPTSLISVADVTSESKNNTLDDHLVKPSKIISEANNGNTQTILKEAVSEIQLKDIAVSSNIEANELNNDKKISQTQSDRIDIDSIEQLSEVIPEDIPTSFNSIADETSESKNNTLEDHLAEPDEIVPDTKNITGETILKEELSEIQLEDIAGSSNIEANELKKDKQISQTESDRNDTDSNEQLSEVIPEDIPTTLNSVADVTSESKNNTLDDHLVEPYKIVPHTKTITGDTIFKEELSEIQLTDIADSSNIEANELNKYKQISQTESDRNDTDSNEQLSEVIPEDIPTSLNSIADETSESKNNTLDHHLAEPDEIVPDAQNISRETIFEEELSEIQLKDIADSSNIEANELNKDKQISQTESDRNDTDSNEQLSEVIPEDIPTSLNSIADETSESKNNTLDHHLAEPDEIVPDAQNISRETILEEELSEIQLKDSGGSSNIEANELNKDKQISQTESDRYDTDSNEQLSEVIPEDIPTSLNSIADETSESKNNTLDHHLAEPDEIVPDAQNISRETIFEEELSEIQLKDSGGSSNIEANELNKDKQISQMESDRNDTDSNEQLSEVIPEDIPTSLNSVADVNSESKNNTLDDHLAEPGEIVPDTQNISRETILKEELSEFQLKEIGISSNIEANELNKDKERNDTVSNELSEVKPEDVPDSFNSSADIPSESKINTLDAHLTKPDEIVPDTQNISSETILKEELSEILLKDIGSSSKIEANKLNKDKQISQTQSDRNDTDSNEQLSEVKPEDIPTSLNSVADKNSESKHNTLDDHLADPDEIIPEAKYGDRENVLTEEVSEIQLKNIRDFSKISANELDKTEQFCKTQPDQNDTVSNEHLSEVKPEDVSRSLNSSADIIFESKNNTEVEHLVESDDIIPATQTGNIETILKDDEIKLQDVPYSSNIAATELDKSEKLFKTQPDQTDLVFNEKLSEIKPQHVSYSSGCVAHKNSKSKSNTLDDLLAKTDEICTETQIVKSVVDVKNIAANELDKREQFSKAQPDENDTIFREQLSKVLPLDQKESFSNKDSSEINPQDMPDSPNIIAYQKSKPKGNPLDELSQKSEEIFLNEKSVEEQNKQSITFSNEQCEVNINSIADHVNNETGEQFMSEKSYNTQPNQTIEPSKGLNKIICKDQPSEITVKCSYDSTTGEALIAPLRSSIKHYGSSTNVELNKNISKDKQSELQHLSLDLTNSYNADSVREIKSQMQEVTSEVLSENKNDQRNSDNLGEIFSKRQYSEMETNKEISPTLEVKYVKSGLKNYNNNENDMPKVSNEISENKFDQASDFEKYIHEVDEHNNLIEKTTLDIAEDQVSLDDTPTVTRQSTVLEIQDTTNHVKYNCNKTTDSLVPDANLPPGKIHFSKKLQRQCRVIDTTPSFEDVSPQSMSQSKAPSTSNSLADLCQKFIHDKHLLTALQNRRRRTLLMHRFLSTLDLPHSTDDSMEKGNNNVHTEELLTDPNPVVCESLTDSDDHDSDHDDCSELFILQINDLNKISYNFINTVLFSDQLSNDSNPYVCTRTNTFEEFFENGIEEKDILAINPNNNSTTNTTLTTTNPIASTEIYSKINTNATKSNSHKQPVTNMSGYTATTSSNQRPLPNDLLTSAVQKRDTSLESARRFRKQHLNHNQVKVERYTDGNYSHGFNINIDVGVGVGVGVGDIDVGVNKDDDDDDVAIFRHFVPGSIAEREYKKWNNAVEMPNNPYAPDALKRRISGSQERFIDLPNISQTKDLNPLDLLNEKKLDADENIKRESDYKRYSRDYYINSSLTTPQLSPARDVSTLENKDNREPTKTTLPSTEKATEVDLYKAIPAQVVESVKKTLSPLSKEHEANTTSTSDDSDTIKMYDFEKQRETKAVMGDKAVTQKEQPIPDKFDTKEEPSCLAFNRSESCGNVVAPARGSTPIAFKFLQPKRKLLEPSQVLSVDEDDPPTASSPSEKPVIEAEVAKALPSVKALARAFLMTTNTTQPQKLWLKKARTLSQHAKKRPPSPKRSLDPGMLSERTRPEDDVTITSDLSSLETDSSSIGIEISNTSDLRTPAPTSANDSAVAGNTSPVPVRQGVLKNNIAFFENLKNK